MIGRKTSLREHPVFLALGLFLHLKQEQKKRQMPSHDKEKHKRLDWATCFWARHMQFKRKSDISDLSSVAPFPNAGQEERSCYHSSGSHQSVCPQEQFVISLEISILSDYRPVNNFSSFISTVRSSVHNNLPRKRALSKRKHCWNPRNLKRRLCVLMWTENIFKTELFQNDYVMISSNTNPVLRSQISPTKCGRKTFDVLSEWWTSFSNFSGVVWTGDEC